METILTCKQYLLPAPIPPRMALAHPREPFTLRTRAHPGRGGVGGSIYPPEQQPPVAVAATAATATATATVIFIASLYPQSVGKGKEG